MQERLCRVCLVLGDERHLLFHCVLYDGERRQLLSKIEARYNGFLSLDIHQMWSFLLSNEDCQCLTWLGKCLYDAFEIRNRYIASISDGNVLWAGVNIHRSRFATCLASWKKSLRILIILHVRTLPIKLHICMYLIYLFMYQPHPWWQSVYAGPVTGGSGVLANSLAHTPAPGHRHKYIWEYMCLS